MNVIKCNNGHYYDKDMYETCPHCTASADGISKDLEIDVADEEQDAPAWEKMDVSGTSFKMPDFKKPSADEEDDNVTIAKPSYSSFDEDDVKTVKQSFGSRKDDNYVIGWLLINSGNRRGGFVPLFMKGSREKGILFSFSNIDKAVYAEIEKNQDTVYINDAEVSGIVTLSRNDKIKISETEYVFVPACSEGFSW